MSKCRLCNKKADFLHSLIGDRTSSKISLYFCKSCNAYYTYPQEYDYHQSDSSIIEYYLNHQEYIEWRHNKIFSFVENTFRVKNNNFLDIGSGLGLSLSVASARGWSSLGVEPCHILAKYSKEHLNLNVLEGFFSPEIQEKIEFYLIGS